MKDVHRYARAQLILIFINSGAKSIYCTRKGGGK
jgi:hypothetical protein